MDTSILLIEQSSENARFLNDVLQAYKYHTMLARTLTEAEGILSRHKLALIILDLSVPDENSLAWITHVQYHFKPSPPILAISARTPPHSLESAQAAGCVDFLAKPFHIRPFITAVQNAMGTPPLL